MLCFWNREAAGLFGALRTHTVAGEMKRRNSALEQVCWVRTIRLIRRVAIASAKMRAPLVTVRCPDHRQPRRQAAALLGAKVVKEQVRQSFRQLLSNFRRLSCGDVTF